jgi:thiol-disulfide isomerase/thioredoxin
MCLFAGLTVLLVQPSVSAEDAEPEAPAVASGMRRWQSVGGSSVEAEFVKMVFGQVHLKTADGKIMKIGVNRLSAEDRQVARQLAESAKPARKVPSWQKEQTPDEGAPVSDGIKALFGDELVTAKRKKVGVSALGGAEKIGIYFSAHWCPPCRAFTPQLVDAYNDMKKDGKPFGLVFVSSDRSKDAMEDYMKGTKMPWYAIPYDSKKRAELQRKFNVRGIPTLVVVSSEGKTLSMQARGDIGSDGRKAYDKW